jgi:4-amino-4-deoxy-L-arabinose transferase-like glycosyltransferase
MPRLKLEEWPPKKIELWRMKILYWWQARRAGFIFLPFLVVYVAYVLLAHRDANVGDEARYLMFAQNLCRGGYAPDGELNLWNGPGYPLVLVPFVALSLPLVGITLLNAGWHYATLLLFFDLCQRFVSRRKALIFSSVLGVYFIFWSEMPLILTESLTVFLVMLTVWLSERMQRHFSKKNLLAFGCTVGYLTLTKIIFGYVLLLGVAVFGVLFLFFKKEKTTYRRAVQVLLVALAVNVPYLTYTFFLTQKMLYWGNSGGMSLYWMSNPHEGEYGEWNSWDFSTGAEYATIPEFEAARVQYLERHHGAAYAQVNALSGVARDDAYKALAWQNIRQNPTKYARNVLSNVGRFFFNAPCSYTLQKDKTLRWLISSVHFSAMLATLLVSLRYWRRLPQWLRFVLILAGLYLVLLSLVSASVRMFNILLPIVYTWVAYVWTRVLRISVAMGQGA